MRSCARQFLCIISVWLLQVHSACKKTPSLLQTPPPPPCHHRAGYCTWWGVHDSGALGQSVSPEVFSLQELRQPLEALSIAHALDNTHHEELDWASLRNCFLHLLPVSHVIEELQALPQLVLRGSHRDVDFVAQHHDGHLREAGLLKKAVQLLFGLLEARTVRCVHEEDDTVHGSEIILPDAARRLMAAQIERLETHILDEQVLIMGVERGRMRRHAVVLQHVQQSRLPRIVEAKEEDLGILVPEPQVPEQVPEPVHNERHGSAQRKLNLLCLEP